MSLSSAHHRRQTDRRTEQFGQIKIPAGQDQDLIWTIEQEERPYYPLRPARVVFQYGLRPAARRLAAARRLRLPAARSH